MSFTRTAYAGDEVWQDDALMGLSGVGFLPAPFGASPTTEGSLRWTDQYYSFVVPVSWNGGAGLWAVRDPSGNLVEFYSCLVLPDGGPATSSTPWSCFATPLETSMDRQDKLYWTNPDGGSGAFIFFSEDGTRYTYGTNGSTSTTWSMADGGLPIHYFLGKVDPPVYPGDGGSARTVAVLTYSAPTCAVWADSNGSGTPYLATVSNEDGAALSFGYESEASPWLGGTDECVLQYLYLAPPTGGASKIATYSYAGPTDGGATSYAGELSSVVYNEATAHSVNYVYFDAGGFVWQKLVGTPPEVPTPIITHFLAADYRTSEAAGVGEGMTIADGGVVSCSTTPGCVIQLNATFSSTVAQTGDGTGTLAPLVTTYAPQQTTFSIPTVVASKSDACLGSGCEGASVGTQTWSYSTIVPDGGLLGIGETTAYQDKNSNTTRYAYLADGTAAAVGFAPVVQTEINTPLTSTVFQYETGGQGQTPVSYEELKTSEYRGSVCGAGMDGDGGMTYVYDQTTNRLEAVFRFGATETLDPATDTWSTGPQVIGTFYFTYGKCSGYPADSQGRTVEVHGPCIVTSTSATDCPAGTATSPNVPVTAYKYYSSGSGSSSNRLEYATRYVNVTSAPTTTSSCTGVDSLTTTFGSYTARGMPGSVTDPNSLTTNYTYEEDRVRTSEDPLGQTTTYSYENGKLVSIEHPGPGGGYETFCYHTGSTTSCNTSDPWSEQLQWKAKSGNASGSGWTEQVTYQYFPDGTLATETYITSAAGQGTRMVVNHGGDPLRRPTFTSWGADGGAGTYSSPRLFDGADNLIGLGLGYNGAPPLCSGVAAGDLPSSPLCQAFVYDASNRLIGMNQNTGASVIYTSLTRDAQDNISAVSIDGGLVGSYQYDDFGNVVAATLSWQSNDGGPTGTTYFQHDALGNVIARQEPGEVDVGGTSEWVTYGFDGIGRETNETRVYDLGADTETELKFYYESQATGSCISGTNYTAGRLQMQADSFGQTWMQYDADGRLLASVGQRNNGGTLAACGTDPYNNPTTSYTYDDGGNMTSITSPYGRKAVYNYGTGGNDRRVQSIDVYGTDDGGHWYPHTSLISNIAWEPYGGLRAYQVNHFAAGTPEMSVYYLREGQPSVPPASVGCPLAVPSTSGGDDTGRVIGIYVLDGGVDLNAADLSASAALFQQRNTYQADQIVRTDTCLPPDNSSTTDRVATYYYDQALRLVGADAGSVDSAPFTHRAYSYDVRGNRTQMMGDVGDCTYSDTESASHPDWLTIQASTCSGSNMSETYAYAQNGDVSEISFEPNSFRPSLNYVFTNGPGGSGSGASDTVFRAVNIGSLNGILGIVYNYFYDARHRRRLKSYPTSGVYDEYFYTASNQIAVDQGNDSATSPNYLAIDDYVWLGDRPVVAIRGTVSKSTHIRNGDAPGSSCQRYGDGAECGFYYPISDATGKEVAIFNDSQLLAGVGEYDPFGRANRVLRDKETPHPYSSAGASDFASFGEPATPGITNELRIHYLMTDLRQSSSFCASGHPNDTVVAVSGTTTVDTLSGTPNQDAWGNWVILDGGLSQVEVSLDIGNPESGLPCVAEAFSQYSPMHNLEITPYQLRAFRT